MRSAPDKHFWIFSIGLLFILLFKLPMQGMFFDGLTYSSISRNLANDIGTFWNPHYTKTLYPVFHEHPPLAFFLQSIFFKVFGEFFWVEKLYSLLAAFGSVFFIKRIWFHLTGTNKYSWLPVVLWIITPIVSWSFSNNMLENTVTVFVLASVWLIIKGLKESSYLLMMLAAIILFGANLVKGFTPLFPLIIPLLYTLIINRDTFRKGITFFVILIVIPLLLVLLLVSFSDSAQEALKEYLNNQVVKSLEGKREVANGRFSILGDMLSQLIVTCAPLILLMIFFFKKVKVKITSEASLIGLVGLSASIPLLVSPKQMGYYLVPSIPFFSICLAIIMIPYLDHFYSSLQADEKKPKLLRSISLFIFGSSIVLWAICYGKPGRDKKLLSDLEEIKKHVAPGETVAVCPSSTEDWTSHAYFQRFASVSLSKDRNFRYFLADENCVGEVGENYQMVEAQLVRFHLFRRKD